VAELREGKGGRLKKKGGERGGVLPLTLATQQRPLRLWESYWFQVQKVDYGTVVKEI